MWSKAFWKATAERAVKTFAQTLAASLVLGTAVWGLPWLDMLGMTLTATLVSVLTSIGSAALTDGSPSAIGAEIVATPAVEQAVEVMDAEPRRATAETTEAEVRRITPKG